MTVFLRLMSAEPQAKGEVLSSAAAAWRGGERPDGIFVVEPSSFRQVPGSPFAYWVSDRVRALSEELPNLEDRGWAVGVGLKTSDDKRFARLRWEVGVQPSRGGWVPFAKGGAAVPWYSPIPLVVNWKSDGAELWAYYYANRRRTGGMVKNPDLYFRPGLTWTPRSQRGFAMRILPAGTIFGNKGPAAFPPQPEDPATELMGMVGLSSSSAFRNLVLLAAAFGSYEVGTVRSTPVPDGAEALAPHARESWELRRRLDSTNQTSSAFYLPAILQSTGPSVSQRVENWSTLLIQREARLSEIQSEIDSLAFDLYEIEGQDRRHMQDGFGTLVESEEEDDPEIDEEGEVEGADPLTLTEALLDWAVGVALGRFDVRLATAERKPPADPGPFDPLPVCSPGMLQDAAGLPARTSPTGYPLELPPHGILVDDPGHPWDVVARIDAVLDLVAAGQGYEWTSEIEDTLGRDLRDWLRRYGFERHLKRYSRSRRKAPLYWHLAPKSRDYGIWLYSPTATRDTFYRILNDYVDPKLKAAERQHQELRQQAGESPTGQQRKELTAQESLVEDLRGFREQVALIAPLWKPYRDDGVVLNCAVLSRLFDHHRVWQKRCAKRWGELAEGKYDWAGWAMHLWPERVVRSCSSDRSIAIAHGLEEALWEEDEDENWGLRSDAEEQIGTLVTERRSPAIESALEAYERAG